MSEKKLKPCPFHNCLTCGCYDTLYMRDKDWNTRPIEDALTARIAELEAAQRWIPVSKRLPEYHERVVFFGGGEMTTHIGYYVPELPQWTAEDGGYYYGKNAALITHWMPLPEPPEGA